MRFYHPFLVAAAIIAVSGAARADGIKMLPPSDFRGNVCAGANTGVLQWDGANPIQCIPGFMGDRNGNVGIGTTTPNNSLDIESSTQYHGIMVGNRTNTTIALVGTSSSNDYGGVFLSAGGMRKVQISADPGLDTYFNNGGKVGIGTATPEATLDIKNATNTATIHLNGSPLRPTCRTVSVTGKLPNAWAQATCRDDEFLMNGGGYCRLPQAPAKALDDGVLATMHDSYPDGNSWVVDCFGSPPIQDVLAISKATCCHF